MRVSVCGCVCVCALTSCVWIFICIYAICLFASWKIQCIQCNATRVPLPILYTFLSHSLSLPLCLFPALHLFVFVLLQHILIWVLLFEAINRNIFLFGFQYATPLQNGCFVSLQLNNTHYICAYIEIYYEIASISLSRSLRLLDQNGSKHLNLQEFKKGIMDAGFDMNESEIEDMHSR